MPTPGKSSPGINAAPTIPLPISTITTPNANPNPCVRNALVPPALPLPMVRISTPPRSLPMSMAPMIEPRK